MTTEKLSLKRMLVKAWPLAIKHIWLLTAVVSAWLLLSLLLESLAGGFDRYVLDPNDSFMQSMQKISTAPAGLHPLLKGLLNAVIVVFFSLGLYKMCLQIVDDLGPRLADFTLFPRKLVQFFLAGLFIQVVTLLGYLFFIVPGFIFLVRFQFTGYFIVEENCSAKQALVKSWQLTKGYTGKLLLFILLITVLISLGLLALGVGFFVAFAWVILTQALIYRFLLQQKPHLQAKKDLLEE